MRRDLNATNQAELDRNNLTSVIMVDLLFDTPVYVSSAAAVTITFDGNDYLGVGELGFIRGPDESLDVVPNAVRLGLSGVDSSDVQAALDAGRYGDQIIIREGYLGRDLRLIDDPWTRGIAFYEFASVDLGGVNQIIITAQNFISVLDEADGSRWNNEDQVRRFAGDTGGSFVTDSVERKIRWGERVSVLGGGSSRPFHDQSERDARDSGSVP